MSKSNERYGKTLFTARLTAEATVQPSRRLQREWEKLDKLAKKKFNKPYDALSDNEKIKLHLSVNLAKEQARRQQKAADSEVEVKHERA